MSFCRFSDDCDVYIIGDDEDGYQCYINDNVLHLDIPRLDEIHNATHASASDLVIALHEIRQLAPSSKIPDSLMDVRLYGAV